jgi:hypothetical protein
MKLTSDMLRQIIKEEIGRAKKAPISLTPNQLRKLIVAEAAKARSPGLLSEAEKASIDILKTVIDTKTVIRRRGGGSSRPIQPDNWGTAEDWTKLKGDPNNKNSEAGKALARNAEKVRVKRAAFKDVKKKLSSDAEHLHDKALGVYFEPKGGRDNNGNWYYPVWVEGEKMIRSAIKDRNLGALASAYYDEDLTGAHLHKDVMYWIDEIKEKDDKKAFKKALDALTKLHSDILRGYKAEKIRDNPEKSYGNSAYEPGQRLDAETSAHTRILAKRDAAKKRVKKESRILSEASKSDQVTEIQKALIELGYDVGSTGADGDYGPATEKAMAKFQQKAGLRRSAKGAALTGPKTVTALIAAVEKNRSAQAVAKPAKKDEPAVGEPKKEKGAEVEVEQGLNPEEVPDPGPDGVEAEVEAEVETKPAEPKAEKPKRKHPLVAVKGMSEVEVGQGIVDLLKASSDDTLLPHVMLSLFAHQQNPATAKEAKITKKDVNSLLYSLALRVGRKDQGEEVRDVRMLGLDVLKNRKDKDVQNILNMMAQNEEIDRPEVVAMYHPEPNGAGLERLGREALVLVDRKLQAPGSEPETAFPRLKINKSKSAEA